MRHRHDLFVAYRDLFDGILRRSGAVVCNGRRVLLGEYCCIDKVAVMHVSRVWMGLSEYDWSLLRSRVDACCTGESQAKAPCQRHYLSHLNVKDSQTTHWSNQRSKGRRNSIEAHRRSSSRRNLELLSSSNFRRCFFCSLVSCHLTANFPLVEGFRDFLRRVHFSMIRRICFRRRAFAAYHRKGAPQDSIY